MNVVVKYVTAIIIGCIVGFIGGFQGTAGGFYITMLLLFTGIAKTQRMAAGTTLLVAVLFPLSIGTVYEYWKTGDVDLYAGLIITFFYMIFSWVGAKANLLVDEQYPLLSLAVLLMLTSFYFFHRYFDLIKKK